MADRSHSPAFPSATVLLVRDKPRFEVLMVRRHHEIEFASGALVFPGGKVDDEDRDPAWIGLAIGLDHLTADERALRVCAVREAFEESGILLARHATDASWAIGPRTAQGREAVARNELGFRELVAELGVKLELGALVPFAHWITPAAMRKRFDTRFYLMTAPADQLAACDGFETVDAEWITPAEALRLGEAGERTIVFPTRLNLKLLAESASAAEALASAAARSLLAIEPLVERRPDGLYVSIPADAGYGSVEPQRL